jgi:intracellular septation protein
LGDWLCQHLAKIAFDQDYLMQDFLKAAKFLLIDLASTIFFLILFLFTQNTVLSVALATALGVAQIAIPLIRREPVYTLEWLSLFLVVAAGTATIATDDPRVMLFKPSVIYAVVGIVMLKAGWIIRYLPAIVRQMAPDAATIVGYTWAGLMFLTAAVNAVVALTSSVHTWAMFMLIFGMVSKTVVFIVGFVAIKFTIRRRVRAMSAMEREALLASVGVYN